MLWAHGAVFSMEERTMTIEQIFGELQKADSVNEIEKLFEIFESFSIDKFSWIPVGNRENNRGIIEVSRDPGRSIIERVTNGIDAILEAEYESHNGNPDCRSPREAGIAWLGVPPGGLSEMTPVQRRQLAHRLKVRVTQGDGHRAARTIEIRDGGVGLKPDQMPQTILSLNESNKLRKHYVAGTYGQGGSSTFAACKYTLISSRYAQDSPVGFTLVRYLELPAEEYKTGHYVYLLFNETIPQAIVPIEQFPIGTQVKHFGYDLSGYDQPLGPNSVYGLLNQMMFDPILPIWLDNQVRDYRRVIKGSRNALNGAIDEGDDQRRGTKLSHNVRMFYVDLGEFGQLGVEYWVLENPSSENKRPTAAFVNPSKPIILTLNGQNHEEMSALLIRKHAELPLLTQRLICHIDCNRLKRDAQRALFSSTREGARRGIIHELIQNEIVRIMRSDDELLRLDEEARQLSRRELDMSALLQMRKEVARLLRLQGLDATQAVGGEAGEENGQSERPTHPRRPRTRPQPIDLHEPPTYIRLLWDEEKEITFYPEQRRYMRVETDANSRYHNPNDPDSSRINVIVTGEGIVLRGSTSLQEGRMRVILEALPTAKIDTTGMVRIELTRPGLPTLSDEKRFKIVEPPPVRPSGRKVSLPPFDLQPVDGPEDPLWTTLGWPENINTVASSAVMKDGKLVIYYSTVYPKFDVPRTAFKSKEPELAASFIKRYEIWLAVHSLLLYQDQQNATPQIKVQLEQDPDFEEAREREERCRIATLAAIFAAREVSQQTIPVEVIEE